MPMLRALPLWSIVLVAVLAVASPAAAQQPPIQQQMSAEEFKATGLDKLSPQELANLNAWLNNTLEVETAKAAELARDKVESETRGFASFGRTDPIVGRIVGEFRGFALGRSWTLDNGQEWEQVDDASLSGVRKADPGVKITPSVTGNVWYMQIDGYNTRAKVRRTR